MTLSSEPTNKSDFDNDSIIEIEKGLLIMRKDITNAIKLAKEYKKENQSLITDIRGSIEKIAIENPTFSKKLSSAENDFTSFVKEIDDYFMQKISKLQKYCNAAINHITVSGISNNTIKTVQNILIYADKNNEMVIDYISNYTKKYEGKIKELLEDLGYGADYLEYKDGDEFDKIIKLLRKNIEDIRDNYHVPICECVKDHQGVIAYINEMFNNQIIRLSNNLSDDVESLDISDVKKIKEFVDIFIGNADINKGIKVKIDQLFNKLLNRASDSDDDDAKKLKELIGNLIIDEKKPQVFLESLQE